MVAHCAWSRRTRQLFETGQQWVDRILKLDAAEIPSPETVRCYTIIVRSLVRALWLTVAAQASFYAEFQEYRQALSYAEKALLMAKTEMTAVRSS